MAAWADLCLRFFRTFCPRAMVLRKNKRIGEGGEGERTGGGGTGGSGGRDAEGKGFIGDASTCVV